MGKVLVVDDNPDACRMMARLVKRCGHDGACATSGEEALAYLRSHPVSLVILDNMMPGMDGVEVLRRLRSEATTAALPVVMWSAVSDRDFIDYALGKGATEYWVKASFEYTELPEKLGKLVPHCDC